jgi:hypothetical protein
MSSLPNLMTALADYVAETIQVDAAQPPVDRVLRYQGGPAPDDCCTDNGILSVWHEKLYPTIIFPIPLTFSGQMDGGLPVAVIGMRYAVCWNPAQVDANGHVIIDDTDWDRDAARLALVDEAVCDALLRLSCATHGDTLWQAVVGEVACSAFRFRDSLVSKPTGGCAAVQWHVVAGLGGSAGT